MVYRRWLRGIPRHRKRGEVFPTDVHSYTPAFINLNHGPSSLWWYSTAGSASPGRRFSTTVAGWGMVVGFRSTLASGVSLLGVSPVSKSKKERKHLQHRLVKVIKEISIFKVSPLGGATEKGGASWKETHLSTGRVNSPWSSFASVSELKKVSIKVPMG